MGLRVGPGAVALLVGVLVALGCRPEEIVGVHGALAATPGSTDFGQVALGQFREERVALRNTSRVPVTVSRLSSTLASVTVSEGGGFTLAPRQERVLVLRFAPAVEGEVAGQLQVESSLLGVERVHDVGLRGVGVRGYVDIHPKVLDFGRVEVDAGRTLPVEVHNPTPVDAHFTLEFAGDDANAFASRDGWHELRVGPGETRQVPLTFRPRRLGLALATARFTRCPSCPPELVALRGEGASGMLEVTPLRLHFGRVALGARAEKRLTMRNTGDLPATLLRAGTEGAQGFYSVVNPPPQTSLQQGQSVEVSVAFQPHTSGFHRGMLWLEVQEGSAPARRLPVELTGVGGGSCVTFLPRPLDFGAVPEGMRLVREVSAFNACTEDVTLSELDVRTTQGGLFSLAGPSTSVVVPGRSEVPVPVAFAPTSGSGSSQGQLTANVRRGSEVGAETVELVGSSRAFGPCQYRMAPDALDFGRVQVGSTVALGVALTNVGTEGCFVASMGMAGGSHPSFSADAFPGGVLAPGATAQLTVRFNPTGAGPFSGMVEGVVNHPTQGRFTLPVGGEGVQDCFMLEPGTADFLTLKLGCGERLQQVMAINRCASEVHLTGAALAPFATQEMRLAEGPPLPSPVAAGASVAFTLAYAPTDEGQDTAAFHVTSLEQGTRTVGLLGQGLVTPTRTDRFVQEEREKVDVLFVVDNSLTMDDEQQGLTRNFAAFLSATLGGGVDYHLGVTTTGINVSSEDPPLVCAGGVHGGEAGRLFPADGSSPRIITPFTPDAAAAFATNTAVGICPQVEQGLEAALRALSPPLVDSADDPGTPLANDGNAGFLREDARLALVFVSDEDDGSPETLAFYEAFFRGLKGGNPSLLSISAIVGPEDLSTCPTAAGPGPRYRSLAQATGGVVESICSADWGRALSRLTDATSSLPTRFPLTQRPADPTRISVTVNGVPVPSGWTYDVTGNSVDFALGSRPPEGALVEVTYPLGC